MSQFIYYRRNVPYVVGGRFHSRDAIGWTLTGSNPYVAVKSDELRDFKLANRRIIMEGLIVETEEPSVDWEVPNAVTPEKITELLKLNYMVFKKELAKIDSYPMVAQILEIAKNNEKPPKTLKMIESRLAELAESTDFISPDMMKGVE